MSLVGSRLSVVFIAKCQFATDHLHACKMLILPVFVEITKFKSFLSSYHLMQKISNEKRFWIWRDIDPLEDCYPQKTFYLGGLLSSFYSKPRHVTPQIDHLRKVSPVLRVSTHIYQVSKEIDGKTFISRVNLGM